MKTPEMDQFLRGRDYFQGVVPWPLPWFVVILFALVLVVLAYTWWGEIDVVVKAQAVLRPEQNISMVKNPVAGPLDTKNFREGQRVRRGDLLWKVNTDTLEVDRANTLKEQAYWKAQAVILEQYGRTVFSSEAWSPPGAEAQAKAQVYASELQKRRLVLEKAREAWEREEALPPTLTTATKVRELERERDLAQLDLDRYPPQMQTQWRSEEAEVKKNLQSLEKALASLERRQLDSAVRAPVDGTVEALKKVNQGDYLVAGEELVRIVPDEAGRLKAQISVDNRDIAPLTAGQKVTYLFTALPPSEYGPVTGRVTLVPSDAEKVSATELTVFLLEGSLDKTVVESRRTGPVSLRSGMTAEARILLAKKPILRFVLEKLDFL